MAHELLQSVTITEKLQELSDSVSALDKVVDPFIEFQFQNTSGLASPNEAFNLPKISTSSSQRKLSYKIDENELPRVHKSSSIQNVASMLRKETFRRNFSESSDYVGSDKTVPNNNSNTCDNESMFNLSSGDCTPNIIDYISFNNTENSPIIPHYQDKLETASNISLASNLTDVADSNISSVSDLTGYEEEIFQIKKLLTKGNHHFNNHSEKLNSFTKSNSDITEYQSRITEVTAQLQETIKENEKLRFLVKDLERKIELQWQEKYQDILREKSYCEGQLHTVRKQHESAVSEMQKILNNLNENDSDVNSLRAEYTQSQAKLSTLEKLNAELNSKLILATNESKQWHAESVKNESENEKLRLTNQELGSELDSKTSILFGLKNKITEQHIQTQNHIQTNLKLNNHITTLHNEIEAVKKSEKWYIDQLHSCQISKSKLQQELMSTQANLIAANQKLEKVKIEVNHWKYLCEETQRKAMREKEKLLRKVQTIEADMLEREAVFKCEQEGKVSLEVSRTARTPEDHSDIIEEYDEQIANLNKCIDEKCLVIQAHQKEIAQYLVRVTTLQKKLNEKEISYQTLEDRNKDLEMRNNLNSEDLRTKDSTILELRNKIVTLEVALHAAAQEKSEIDGVVKNLRDDFNKFMKCYKNMKEKLDEKVKIITQFEHDKQELFMESNWRKCEIEELQQKLLNVKQLQAEIMQLRNLYNEGMMEKEALEMENDGLKTANEDMKADCDNLRVKIYELETILREYKNEESLRTNENVASLTKDITNLENEILKLNEMLQMRESQLVNQTKNCEILNREIEEKEQMISDLKQKLSYTDNILDKYSTQTSENKKTIENLRTEICTLNKKISDANTVIDHFNILCRNSELERHNLSTQLKLLANQKQDSIVPAEEVTQCEGAGLHCAESRSTSTQTDFPLQSACFDEILETINLKLSEIVSDNNNVCHPVNEYSKTLNLHLQNSKNFASIHEYLSRILYLKESQVKQIESSEKSNKILKSKLLKLKSKINSKLVIVSERCASLENNYVQLHNAVKFISNHRSLAKASSESVAVQTAADTDAELLALAQEIKDLKSLLRVSEIERKEQCKRFEMNNRTLLRKVKEHIRGRKVTEKKLASLLDTYKLALTEINNLKILNGRLEIELDTFKSRTEEYKEKCLKLNETIIVFEREKGQSTVEENTAECLNCLEKNKLNQMLTDCEYKLKSLEEKIVWYEKELSDKEQGITECKKQLFNEKLQCSALKKQLASIQMCLDNANEQLDAKNVEITQLKALLDKLRKNEEVLVEQFESAQNQCEEYKRKFETTNRLLEETKAKDEILADEIKTLSCHLHQKTLELANIQSNLSVLETQLSSKETSYQKNIDELQENLTEMESELGVVRSDKFFLQRLCADLKMSLQSTLNQNKVLKVRLETLEVETKDLSEKLKCDSLTSLPSPSKIDEEHINRLLQQSTVLPERPLQNLRSCLNSLKEEMATLQKEIIAKTQSDISF